MSRKRDHVFSRQGLINLASIHVVDNDGVDKVGLNNASTWKINYPVEKEIRLESLEF